MSGAEIVIVPYKNSPDIVVALLRNDVDMTLEFPQYRRAGERAQAAHSRDLRRASLAVPLPAGRAAGVAGYNVTSRNGIFAPAGTPQAIVDKLNKAVREVVAEADVKEKFAKLGVRAEASSPDGLKQWLKNDTEKWAAVIEKAGIPLRTQALCRTPLARVR